MFLGQTARNIKYNRLHDSPGRGDQQWGVIRQVSHAGPLSPSPALGRRGKEWASVIRQYKAGLAEPAPGQAHGIVLRATLQPPLSVCSGPNAAQRNQVCFYCSTHRLPLRVRASTGVSETRPVRASNRGIWCRRSISNRHSRFRPAENDLKQNGPRACTLGPLTSS
jgi:hypothetical protein